MLYGKYPYKADANPFKLKGILDKMKTIKFPYRDPEVSAGSKNIILGLIEKNIGKRFSAK